jgi:hypothetical protein
MASASAARGAAARHALGGGDIDPGATWLAHTDADCTVPPWWLARLEDPIGSAPGLPRRTCDTVVLP